MLHNSWRIRDYTRHIKYFKIPFIEKLSARLNKILTKKKKKKKSKITYKSEKKNLNRSFTKTKVLYTKEINSGIVYSIPCKDFKKIIEKRQNEKCLKG